MRSALAEIGPAAGAALPALERAFHAAAGTNLPAAHVLGAAMERLNPGAPKPLLLMSDLLPALEAVQAEARRAGEPSWQAGLEVLPRRVPLGLALLQDDARNLAVELANIHPSLRRVFVDKLLEVDRRFAALFPPAP